MMKSKLMYSLVVLALGACGGKKSASKEEMKPADTMSTDKKMTDDKMMGSDKPAGSDQMMGSDKKM